MTHLFGLSVLLQFLCLVHMVRSGRPYWWTWIIVVGSFLGVGVYLLTQVLPDLQQNPHARRAARGLHRRLDPTRELRRLRDELARADTVQNRLQLAGEFSQLGEHAEAEGILRECLKGLHASDADILLALAQAQFAQGKAEATVATLNALKAANPDFRSADGHLLYARALEALDRAQDALAEYAVLDDSYPGEEARVRMAELLCKLGRDEQARALLEKALARVRIAPPYYRKAQREWIARAQRMLKG
ncbi:MAG: tetratricopeptide repeat protein [Xanthomonadales bacterium]|nr:hypothetical protein [Xanthomonadales bacterium]MCC6591645.1 tetratricopeptide repeat protein [Xanthomonadales bacterium]MCE7932680.1 hypothetical protein [Xanthomonadales bacterium PRO6]